jgi:hypothetical protein
MWYREGRKRVGGMGRSGVHGCVSFKGYLAFADIDLRMVLFLSDTYFDSGKSKQEAKEKHNERALV